MIKQTGPKTPEGKKRSSLNALKHGFTATSPHALQAAAERYHLDFGPILEEVSRHYCPCDAVEELLVKRIARCVWRIARAEMMESGLLDRNPYSLKPGTSLQKVMDYERTADLQLYRAIKALDAKRSGRQL